MEKVVIVSAARTPIGRFGGNLRKVPAYQLASVILQHVVDCIDIDPSVIDDVIMGQSYQNGECANGARVALLDAGWPDSVPGVTLDRRCCSGLDAVFFGVMKIQTGNADIVVAGGMDSMSQAELYLPGNIRWGLGGKVDEKWGFMPKGHGSLAMWGIPFYDRIQRARVMSQPIERYGELNSMMSWAEAAAKNEKITRKEADVWALRSHQRAIKAIEAGKFKDEIVPIEVPTKKGAVDIVEKDETPRADVTLEKLARLKPVYSDGVCTAGNSSSENDGAAAVVIMSKTKATQLGLTWIAEFKSCAIAGANPTLTYPAVPASVTQALKKVKLSINEIDLIEIQEAFAVQTIADAKLMGVKTEEFDTKINVNGSGISLGHPIAATGVMRLITLMYEMKRLGVRYGLETICGGGGQGICAVFENNPQFLSH